MRQQGSLQLLCVGERTYGLVPLGPALGIQSHRMQLAGSQQRRLFQQGAGQRRVGLERNVAEDVGARQRIGRQEAVIAALAREPLEVAPRPVFVATGQRGLSPPE